MTAKKARRLPVPLVGNGQQPSDQLCRKNYEEKLSATCNEFNVELAKDCQKSKKGFTNKEEGFWFSSKDGMETWKLPDEKAEEAMPQVEKAGNT
jgi:hypothetical protein